MCDWQVGDLALCVKVGAWVHAGTGEAPDSESLPQPGGVYVVRAIGNWEDFPVLWLEEFPGDKPSDAFGAIRFVKITPPEADAFDTEVIEQMKGAPVDA